MHPTTRAATAACLLLSAALPAQFGGNGADGDLHPVATTTLDTDLRPDGWSFRSIDIPAGVTVRLVGSHPAILRAQTTIRIAGHLNADGFPAAQHEAGAGGPGGYAGGAPGQPGLGPAGGAAGLSTHTGNQLGGNAGHATPGRGLWMPPSGVYGSSLPFDLRGGSGGGGFVSTVSGTRLGGDGGGGVVILVADGAIDVPGTVSADGAGIGTTRSGAGGSILIRSASPQVRIDGRLSADGPQDTLPGPISGRAGDGFIRVDAWGREAAFGPTATAVPEALKHILPDHDSDAAALGQQWLFGSRAVPNDLIAVLVSSQSTPTPMPPLGTYGLGPPETCELLGLATAGDDVYGYARFAAVLPNDPRLRGVTIWTQAVTLQTSAASGPRLSNWIRHTFQ